MSRVQVLCVYEYINTPCSPCLLWVLSHFSRSLYCSAVFAKVRSNSLGISTVCVYCALDPTLVHRNQYLSSVIRLSPKKNTPPTNHNVSLLLAKETPPPLLRRGSIRRSSPRFTALSSLSSPQSRRTWTFFVHISH